MTEREPSMEAEANAPSNRQQRNLYDCVRARLAPLGGVDPDLPKREPGVITPR